MSKLKHLLISLIASASLFVIFSSSAHAATFTVATGNDENTDNSSCALTEAIENINDQATTNTDCSPTGAYGTDDTINLPSGTITLTANIPAPTESISIQGQGMGVSVIDGDSAYSGLSLDTLDSVEISGITMQNYINVAIYANNVTNAVIEQFEARGVLVQNAAANGLVMVSTTASDIALVDVYIHDIDVTGAYVNPVIISTDEEGEINLDAQNITISDVTVETGGINGFAFGAGVVNPFGDHGGVATGVISNITVTGLHMISDAGGGESLAPFSISGISDDDSTDVDVDVNNITIANNQMDVLPAIAQRGAVNFGGASSGTATATINVDIANVFLANNVFAGTNRSCDIFDLTGIFGGSGTVNFNLTSQGGNLSDDNSCSSYFTESTDQNNLTSLGSTLSALADNGGYVPTMALKQGSPAIDSGITIPTLTTDARGEVRPQGNAYDSGAYESPYTRSEDEADSSTDSLASTGQNIRLAGIFAAILLALGLMLHLRRQYV